MSKKYWKLEYLSNAYYTRHKTYVRYAKNENSSSSQTLDRKLDTKYNFSFYKCHQIIQNMFFLNIR